MLKKTLMLSAVLLGLTGSVSANESIDGVPMAVWDEYLSAISANTASANVSSVCYNLTQEQYAEKRYEIATDIVNRFVAKRLEFGANPEQLSDIDYQAMKDNQKYDVFCSNSDYDENIIKMRQDAVNNAFLLAKQVIDNRR